MEVRSPSSRSRNARVTEKPGCDKAHVLGALRSARLKAYIHCSTHRSLILLRLGKDVCEILPDGWRDHYDFGNMDNLDARVTRTKRDLGHIDLVDVEIPHENIPEEGEPEEMP
uniref:Uncharacterized protein n=1 Tax=Oryza sativa subsp. japonica TaxID=39947 RepID=Q2QR24_ORYSJ|nr:hypothetical protein LOC_Os12g29050 [Oryza sativa Japonica Group]